MKRASADLESVLGASPRGFESRILRQLKTASDLRKPRLPPDHARGEGERSAICDVGDALSHDLHLTERFFCTDSEEIGALKLLKRFERNGAHELKWLRTAGCITPNRITC